MWEFTTFTTPTARKVHWCEQCRQPIEIGQKHSYFAGKCEGIFSAYREHLDCRAAWTALNFDLRDYPEYEGAPFFPEDSELVASDLDWLRDRFPAVAARLTWLAPKEQATP